MNQQHINKSLMDLDQSKQADLNCCRPERCPTIGLEGPDLKRLDNRVTGRRRHMQRGGHAFRTGKPFHDQLAIRSGFFKTYELPEDEQLHRTGFNITAERFRIQCGQRAIVPDMSEIRTQRQLQ